MLDAGIAELDPEARLEIYVDILGQIIEDAAFLVLYQPVDRKPASASVQGVATHSVYMLNLRNASKTA
jgi:ABC-type transport system substrate-binding protein